MHYELTRCNTFALAEILQQCANELRTLAVIYLPTNYFAAEKIDKEVQVEVAATHLRGQVGDVPTLDLLRPAGRQGTRLAAPLRRALKSAVHHLARLVQQSVKGRLACDLAHLIGQAGNDLAGRQVFELLGVDYGHAGVALVLAEFVGRLSALVQADYSAVPMPGIRVLPPLHGALTQANLGAGPSQSRTARAGLLN